MYQHLWVTLAFSFHISGTDKQLCFLFMFSVLCWGHHLLFHVFGWGNYQSIMEKIRLLQKFQCSVFAESLMFFQSPHRAWLCFIPDFLCIIPIKWFAHFRFYLWISVAFWVSKTGLPEDSMRDSKGWRQPIVLPSYEAYEPHQWLA